MHDLSRLLFVTGSVRQGRFGPVVASWVADRARDHGGFEVDVVDLAQLDIPLALPADPPKTAGAAYPRPEGMTELTRALDAADAFILITPEYNHSYPASLKAAIDWHFTQWQAKPVAFVSYGGSAGGRHAVPIWRTCSPSYTPSRSATGWRSRTTSPTSRTDSHSTHKHPNTPRPCSNSSPGGPPPCARPAPKSPTPPDPP
jgi:NAD(P)H-dependent FMN reductase